MNMLEKYQLSVNHYLEEFKKNPNIVGIMHLGGIARGRADEYSDIDVALFSYEPLKEIIIGEQLTPEGYDLEVFNIVINKGYKYWDPIMKEAYEEGVICYDPQGIVKDFIDKALKYENKFRCQYLAKLIFKIAWHGWIYTPYRNNFAKNYHWILPENLWFLRGDESNVYYLTQVCINDFIELLFVINRKWSPDYKWRLIKARKLPILPTNFDENINYLLFTEWNLNTWETKRQVFQQMIDEMIALIIDDMPEDWYALL